MTRQHNEVFRCPNCKTEHPCGQTKLTERLRQMGWSEHRVTAGLPQPTFTARIYSKKISPRRTTRQAQTEPRKNQ